MLKAEGKSEVKVYNREYFTDVEVLGTIVEENYGKEPNLSANTEDLLFGG